MLFAFNIFNKYAMAIFFVIKGLATYWCGGKSPQCVEKCKCIKKAGNKIACFLPKFCGI